MKETCNSGKWLPEEEKRLTQAVYDLTGGRPGNKFAKMNVITSLVVKLKKFQNILWCQKVF